MSTSLKTIAAIRAEDACRVALLNAGREPWVPAVQLLSDADVELAAAEREAGRASRPMVLRRALMAAFNTAVEAGDLERAEALDAAYSAACRGDAGWAERARRLVATAERRAA